MRKKELIFAATLLILLSGCVQLSEEQLKQGIDAANYCNAKEDCVNIADFPYQCHILMDSLKPPFLVNKADAPEITALLNSFCEPSKSYVGMIGIAAYCDEPLIKCENGKCVGSCPQSAGEYCENSDQCFQVPCFEGLAICKENKCACSSPPEEAVVEFVRSYPLEAGWNRSEVESYGYWRGGIATIVFENSEIICKSSVMPGVEPKPVWVFAFFESGKEPDPEPYPKGLSPMKRFFFKNETIFVFTQCGESFQQLPSFIEKMFSELEAREDFSTPLEHSINFLRNYSLQEGWVRAEQEFSRLAQPHIYDDKEKNPANITFKNDEIICKPTVMNAGPVPVFTFSFYKKGFEPTAFVLGSGPSDLIEVDEHIILLFSDCGSSIPTFIQELTYGLGRMRV